MTDTDKAVREKSAPAAPGETFGQYLARERELRGFSILQISDQTRIGQANLKALEADDLSRLPERVFVLGYIRSYAHAIGLSADEAVLRYEELHQKSGPPELEEVQRSRKGRVIVAVILSIAAVGGGVAWLLLRR